MAKSECLCDVVCVNIPVPVSNYGLTST